MAAPAPTSATPQPVVRLSRKKKLAFSICVQLLALVGLELAARVSSYFYYGRNPYYLFYGLRSWTDEEGEGHSEKHRGYFKFPANRTITTGTPPLVCRIGNHGFRGADFEAEKPTGVRRVICMGASSTFGYFDHDDETYPYYLQSELESRLGASRVEVINSGIPHSTSSNVLALLRAELLGYQPDVLTFYEGYNDASHPLAETTLQALSRWFDEYSAAYAGLRKVVTSVAGPVLFGRWSEYLPHMDRATIERQLALHLEEWRTNLEGMLALAAAARAPLVLVRQPITLWFDRVKRGQVEQADPRPTYEEEYAEIATELDEGGVVDGLEARLYIHHHLLDAMDAFAREHSLVVVDNVALLAEHPEGLGSMVHLLPAANQRLAHALASAIEPLLSR